MASELVELGVRAHSTSAYRDSYPFADASAFQLRGSGMGFQSASTPNIACGGTQRLLQAGRRFSQQLSGAQSSPIAEAGQCSGQCRVYVMLPLDTVNAEGVFRYAGSSWFSQALQLLVQSGAHGVAMDFWWGAVEKSPGVYNWAGYKQALEVIKQTGLKVQAVLSFHACGGNVGDTAQIPLPDWVLQCGEADPDLFFADRPRNGGLGNRNREYVSIWADDAPGVLRGRSPLQCYEDFMVSFRDNLSQELGSVIDEVVVGAGPCGELRLPSYVESNGWRFPGAGEFQCYDRRALASLAQAAREAGHPEWGYSGPHDAGDYNSLPEHTGFFNSTHGSWNTPYGRFFLEWYSGCLLRHGERLLNIANQVFGSRLHGAPHGLLAHSSNSTLHHSYSQPYSFAQMPSQFAAGSSGGRMSNMSLNRIAETGGSSSSGGDDDTPDTNAMGEPCSMPPPSGPTPRRQSGMPQSGSASALNSGQSMLQQSGGSGAFGSIQGVSPRTLTAPGGVLASFVNAVEPMPPALGARASACSNAVRPSVARGVGVVAACTAVAFMHGSDAGVPGSGGNARVPLGSGTADCVLMECEPSDASQTSALMPGEVLQAPPLNTGCSGYSGPLCSVPAPPAAGPVTSTLSAVRFMSSASTLTDSEVAAYGGGHTSAVFAGVNPIAAAATGVLAASGSAARMDICNSHSSLSTEFTATGTGAHQAGMLYLDVAASLVADVDDEIGSEIGTSCTGGTNEEGDDLFMMTALAGSGPGGSMGMAARGCMSDFSMTPPGAPAPGVMLLPGAFAEESRRRSADLSSSGSVRAAMGAAAGAFATLFSPAGSSAANISGGGSAGGGYNGGIHLALKIAGIHWWYRSRSHAAELTAGYYNTSDHDGYAAILDMCARHRAHLVVTCVEMCDSQHPAHASCGPEGLLRQLRQLAARTGVSLSGENALPIFSSGGANMEALDRIVANMRSCQAPNGRGSPQAASCSSLPAPLPSSSLQLQPLGGSNIVTFGYRMCETSGRMVPVCSVAGQSHGEGPGQSGACSISPSGLVAGAAEGAASEPCAPATSSEGLPALRAFTFLRLVPEMLLPGYQGLWLRFMGRMQQTA